MEQDDKFEERLLDVLDTIQHRLNNIIDTTNEIAISLHKIQSEGLVVHT